MSIELAYQDAFNILCDEKIGAGSCREVYTSTLLPNIVIKVETEAFRTFQNAMEHAFWQDAKDHDEIARWLAPVRHISPEGRILIQDRVMPIAEHDLPRKLPTFLNDIKPANFGRLGERIVCCDYGYIYRSVNTTLKRWDK